MPHNILRTPTRQTETNRDPKQTQKKQPTNNIDVKAAKRLEEEPIKGRGGTPRRPPPPTVHERSLPLFSVPFPTTGRFVRRSIRGDDAIVLRHEGPYGERRQRHAPFFFSKCVPFFQYFSSLVLLLNKHLAIVIVRVP